METIQQLLLAGMKIKELIGDTAPSLSNCNTPMCMLYHLHGGCWSLCASHDDHQPQMIGKQTRLAAYIQA